MFHQQGKEMIVEQKARKRQFQNLEEIMIVEHSRVVNIITIVQSRCIFNHMTGFNFLPNISTTTTPLLLLPQVAICSNFTGRKCGWMFSDGLGLWQNARKWDKSGFSLQNQLLWNKTVTSLWVFRVWERESLWQSAGF